MDGRDSAVFALGAHFMISWDEDFSISRDGHKTSGSGPGGIVNSPGNFNILLQPPTVTVGAINRIRPCCAPAANLQMPPSTVQHASFLWLRSDTHATHTNTERPLVNDGRPCGLRV